MSVRFSSLEVRVLYFLWNFGLFEFLDLQYFLGFLSGTDLSVRSTEYSSLFSRIFILEL